MIWNIYTENGNTVEILEWEWNDKIDNKNNITDNQIKIIWKLWNRVGYVSLVKFKIFLSIKENVLWSFE